MAYAEQSSYELDVLPHIFWFEKFGKQDQASHKIASVRSECANAIPE
jgi:hypothetical protein